MILKKVNQLITNYNKSQYQSKHWKELDYNLKNVFKEHGEGIYYCNLKQSKADNSLISKLISKYTHEYTHTIAILYKENLFQYLLTTFGRNKRTSVLHSLFEYYNEKTVTIDNINCLVLSSADAIGMMCCDFSNYQTREFTLRKIHDASESEVNRMVLYMLNQISEPYDATGLIAWPLTKISYRLFSLFDSEYQYCSESVYEMALMINRYIAEKDDPSPYDIEKYNAYPIILDTRK